MASRKQARVGRYILFKSLKKGGMARVFLAVDPEAPEELLAIKTLLPDLRKQRTYREMFDAEGKVAVRLQHPHIVRTVEHGDGRGGPFIAMDFIFGFDVSTALRALRKQGRSMPAPLAVALARDVASALHYAHALVDEFDRPLEIVNRDVSPGNIMIAFDGHIRLIDFGIAQTTIDVKSQIGSIKGKISYMAPEQVRGLPVDHRVDIFGLGTVLYEMLTGVQPFHDEGDFATMERVRRAEFEPASSINPAVDAGLDDIIARAMARDAENRYPYAGDMQDALHRWLLDRDEAVRAEDFAELMRGLFAERIADMTADIEQARAQALGGGSPLASTPVATESGAMRLISEDMLAEFAGLASEADLPLGARAEVEPPPPAPANSSSGSALTWILVAVVVLIVGLLWAFGVM